MPCLKAASLMCLKKVRRIPVTEDGKLVGIISIGDVHKAIFQQHLVNNVS
jgi:predicted transcriptional regulator